VSPRVGVAEGVRVDFLCVRKRVEVGVLGRRSSRRGGSSVWKAVCVLAILAAAGYASGVAFGIFPNPLSGLGGGTPVTTLLGTTLSTPDNEVVGGATVKVYADPQLTQLIATTTSDSSTGEFSVNGNFKSGQTVYIQAEAADNYISPVYAITIGEPDANSQFALPEAIVLGDMCTSTDLTMSITLYNGTAVTTGANISASDLTGWTVRVTGLAEGEALGYEDVLYGVSGKQIVQQPILRIVVTGGSLYFSQTPDYVIDNGNTKEYIFIMPWVKNSAYDNTDGILTFNIGFEGTQNSAISDIDIYLYVNADDLDTPILQSNIAQGNFASYTAVESILNIDVIA